MQTLSSKDETSPASMCIAHALVAKRLSLLKAP